MLEPRYRDTSWRVEISDRVGQAGHPLRKLQVAVAGNVRTRRRLRASRENSAQGVLMHATRAFRMPVSVSALGRAGVQSDPRHTSWASSR